ncbi:MAG: UbiD family decarboxylase [Hyphomicrobiales bacterium]|nr:UbiD family decarboxylase [Hyphomicrobiales bacterium]
MLLPNTVRSGLDAWLERVEAIGELKRVGVEVDPDLEMTTLAYLNGSRKGPALLFENIKGMPGQRALLNIHSSSISRLCVTMGEQPVRHPLEAIRILQKKMQRTLPPEPVSGELALCNENIVDGDGIDVTKLAAPRFWPLDGGRYLGTANAVITQDPDTGRVNLGTYRMMIKAPREIGVYIIPGKDGSLDRDKWWKRGKPVPIAAAVGINPALFLAAATSFPEGHSEYDHCGGILGAPVKVFKSEVTGLPLPADAEIVIEGFLHPGDEFMEGPFGEFCGYYGEAAKAPFFKIERLRYRTRPTLTCAIVCDGGASDNSLMWGLSRAAATWSDLEKLGISGIQGVWSVHEAAAGGFTIVSVKQMYPGHATQVMTIAAGSRGSAFFGKYVIVVDHDIDPTDIQQVLWAMATRSRPAYSIEFLRDTWNTFTDPSINPRELRPFGSKCLINACMDYRFIDTFPKRERLSRTSYDRVAARWREFGLDGDPPMVKAFEETSFSQTYDGPGAFV